MYAIWKNMMLGEYASEAENDVEMVLRLWGQAPKLSFGAWPQRRGRVHQPLPYCTIER